MIYNVFMEGKIENVNIEDFFNKLFDDAVKEDASDIHIEPLANSLRIRFRIDGKLQERYTRPIFDLEPIINKIKVLADLELISKPIPQDGHFELVQVKNVLPEKKEKPDMVSADARPSISEKLSGLFSKNAGITTAESKSGEGVVHPQPAAPVTEVMVPPNKLVIDVRVSIFPTINGEAMVLRLLNRAEMLMRIDDFEMFADARVKLRKLIARNYGMLLVTGPAGSGKTSMLYSILSELKTVEKNIITLEDPVEYGLDEIRQSPIRPEKGLTFATGMKSILRQDPDIIMIGEIRDPETAEHGIRAALMGRAVFSTVHSNSSVGIIARFIDMGIERSLVAYSLNGSVAKRLVRKICPSCKIEYTPDDMYLDNFGLKKGEYKFTKGAGCEKCKGTGFKGRLGIFEVMEIDDNMRALIMEKAPMNLLQDAAIKAGMQTLKEDAIQKVLAGQTTIEEVMAVV